MAMRGLVSLTFDGTSLGHLELAVPRLEQYGMLGTFYADPATLLEEIDGWREVQSRGHEIGNGCLICAAQPDGSLPDWPLQTIADDIDVAETLLVDLFPHAERSFGYPWGTPSCADGGDYRFAVKAHYDLARSGVEGHNLPRKTDFLYLRSVLANDFSADDLIKLARPALEGEWIIFSFLGIGEGDRGVDRAAFDGLVEYLNAQAIEVATVAAGSHLWQTRATAKATLS